MIFDLATPFLEIAQVDHFGLVGVDQPLGLAIQGRQLPLDPPMLLLLAVVDCGIPSAFLVLGLEELRVRQHGLHLGPNELVGLRH